MNKCFKLENKFLLILKFNLGFIFLFLIIKHMYTSWLLYKLALIFNNINLQKRTKMDVQIDKTDNTSEIKLTISVASKTINEKVNKELINLAKKQKIDGFRPGKAPLAVIKQKYLPNVQMDVMQKEVSSLYVKALEEKKIEALGMPKIDITSDITKDKFEFVALTQVYPEFNIDEKIINEMDITSYKVKLTPEDILEEIKELQKDHKTQEEVQKDHKTQNGNIVKIDFEGFIKKEAFAGGMAKDFELELGSNKMIPGFETGILDKKIGDEFEIEVTFPKDYHDEKLKGKDTTFKIKINSITKSVPAKLDKEFFAKVDKNATTLEQLKKILTDRFTHDIPFQTQANLKTSILKYLSKKIELEIPQVLIDEEAKNIKNVFLRRQKLDEKLADTLPNDPFVAQAKEQTKEQLILKEIIKKYSLKPIDKDTKQKKEELLEIFTKDITDPKKKEETINMYNKNNNFHTQAQNLSFEKQVIDFIFSKSKRIEKEVSFSEFNKEISNKNLAKN